MHFTGQIYRPPQERLTALLEVTSGCSYNKCAFCSMYGRTPFRASPMEDIESDLRELRAKRPNVPRLYLVNGDPFALSGEQLADIARLAHEILPELKKISCHASILNLKTKTDEELRTLAALGYDELYIGIETGLDSALKLIRKGCTAHEQRECLARLRDAGISYRALLILGVAGREKSGENSAATAALLNEYPPLSMHTAPLVIHAGSELERLRDSGAFRDLTEGEMLDEEKQLISLITSPVQFCGNQAYNLLPVRGRLPRDREKILAWLDAARAKVAPTVLSAPVRRPEGI